MKTLVYFSFIATVLSIGACNNDQGAGTGRGSLVRSGAHGGSSGASLNTTQMIKGADGVMTEMLVHTNTDGTVVTSPILNKAQSMGMTTGTGGGTGTEATAGNGINGMAPSTGTGAGFQIPVNGTHTLNYITPTTEQLPTDQEPLVIGHTYGTKDCSVHTNRQAGDICGYDFCGGDAGNSFLTPAAYSCVKAVMGYLSTAQHVNATTCKDSDIVTMLENLTTLDISNQNVQDISCLTMMASLTSLNISHNQISDLGALRYMSKLVTLRADYNNLSSLAGISNDMALTQCSFSNNQLTDVSVISSLTNVTTLDISSNKVGSIIFLTDRNITVKADNNPGIITEFQSSSTTGGTDNCIHTPTGFSDFFSSSTLGTLNCGWNHATVLVNSGPATQN